MVAMELKSVVEIIRAKRNGRELDDNEIQAIVFAVSVGKVSDAQIGAFLMATFLNGLSIRETNIFTKAMTFSGFTFEWRKEWRGSIVDKHSTGGVGDKTSLVLAPALAACGLRVPMISGRGLELTGGTLDKLESIPGFSVSQDEEGMQRLLESGGCCIVGQTDRLVPADKHFYRIRDTTATVDHENLIVCSVISKKAAENLDALVLDIKVGSGTFMKDVASAESLARRLVETGNSLGMKVTAFLTNMDTPLGNAVGNALEVAEAIQTLQNKGPKDLLHLVLTLGAQLLKSTGRVQCLKNGELQILKAIESGEALRRFERMIVGQGTSAAVAQEICHGDKWKHLPKSTFQTPITADSTGFVESLSALAIAEACHGLGCGRKTTGSAIKYHPGVLLKKKEGDMVTKGETLMIVHHNEGDVFSIEKLQKAVKVTEEVPHITPLVIKVIQ